jgi:hypothetical protein
VFASLITPPATSSNTLVAAQPLTANAFAVAPSHWLLAGRCWPCFGDQATTSYSNQLFTAADLQALSASPTRPTPSSTRSLTNPATLTTRAFTASPASNPTLPRSASLALTAHFTAELAITCKVITLLISHSSRWCTLGTYQWSPAHCTCLLDCTP